MGFSSERTPGAIAEGQWREAPVSGCFAHLQSGAVSSLFENSVHGDAHLDDNARLALIGTWIMGRHGEGDRQALADMAALLLSLAALALATGTLPASRRFVLLAVLRHAADLACAFAGTIHAPVDCRSWPAPGPESGEDDAIKVSGVLRAVACALAVLALHATHAANWLVHPAFPSLREAGAISDAVTLRPRAADTS